MTDELPRPEPGAGQLLIRVKAAAVGNWDALVRGGKIQNEYLPLVLGYERSGIVEATGAGVSGQQPSECVLICLRCTVGDDVERANGLIQPTFGVATKRRPPAVY